MTNREHHDSKSIPLSENTEALLKNSLEILIRESNEATDERDINYSDPPSDLIKNMLSSRTGRSKQNTRRVHNGGNQPFQIPMPVGKNSRAVKQLEVNR